MESFVLGELRIDVAEESGRLVLRWRGACRERNPGVTLTPFFEGALARAIERALPVELHFEALSYFNSSTVGMLLRFIEAAVHRKVKVRLLYDATQRWQGHNFEAIALLNRTGSTVEVHRVEAGQAPERVS